ncbi:hypothetical protein CRG98_046374 [Punica granatum]|uniref:Integrase catalytic domain-containing protein n=1 Tax=Punica granatum TaxID=22663 RepID=A0A2I0HND7_PUNGR|nr:hypothetical protein CRG98_046374 [Punica granatum]
MISGDSFSRVSVKNPQEGGHSQATRSKSAHASLDESPQSGPYSNIIARYGVPATIIADNAKNLSNKIINELCEQFKVQHRNSTQYHPQMNGAVEAANKNIKKIIEKMMVTYKDWHEMFLFALLAYRTSIRTSTGATPYSLVYVMEAVLPIEMEIPFIGVLAESELEETKWPKQRYEQLNLIDERRLTALCRGQCYQQKLAQAFNTRALHPFHLSTFSIISIYALSIQSFSSEDIFERKRIIFPLGRKPSRGGLGKSWGMRGAA